MNYYVICRLDSLNEREKGKYALVTSESFPAFEIAENYSKGIAPSREPKILLEVTPLENK